MTSAGSGEYRIVDSTAVFQGRVISLRVDEVAMSDGSIAKREIVGHPGAVAILALDDTDCVVLVNQYRVPVHARLDELPAGLLDVPGEAPLHAAQRELSEEAHLVADQWDVLLDLHTSPGMTDEAIRVYLARGLRPSTDLFDAEHEELTMTVSREPLAEATRRAFAGELTNAATVAGILAAVSGRAADWRDLRPADAPWPSRAGA